MQAARQTAATLPAGKWRFSAITQICFLKINSSSYIAYSSLFTLITDAVNALVLHIIILYIIIMYIMYNYVYIDCSFEYSYMLDLNHY